MTIYPKPELTLNLKYLPILSAVELLNYMGIDTRLNDWRTLIGLDDSMFNPYVQQPFYRYAEAIQLCPASESDHHAGPGGLLVHTYDVITLALKKRRGLQLPKGGTVDQINAQRHLWTYAVFAGGLLHDIGKLLGSIRMVIQLTGGKELNWTPHDAPIGQNNLAHSYRIEFIKTPYSYHTQVALTLFDFLPTAARAWLARDPTILMQLCAYLRGDRYESGVIGEILETADMSSTAAAQLRPVSQRFSNKPSIIERLAHFVRNWIAEGEIKLNKNGGMGWVDQEGFIYIVCRALADKIIRHCDDLGITDLPRDPVRLYDIFQDYGLALPTADNRAIWNVQIACAEYTHHFTCLKFEARRLVVPTRLPVAFQGSILDESELKKIKKPQAPKSEIQLTAKTNTHDPEINHEADARQETDNAESALIQEAEIIQEFSESKICTQLGGEYKTQEVELGEDIHSEAVLNQIEETGWPNNQETAKTLVHKTVFQSDDTEAEYAEENETLFRDTLVAETTSDQPQKTECQAQNTAHTIQEATAFPEPKILLATQSQQNQETECNSLQETVPTLHKKFSQFTLSGEPVFEPGAVTMDNEQLPRMFVQWLRINVLERRIAVNKPNALVHVSDGFVLLVAPAIFINFLKLHGLDGKVEHPKLSKRFARLRHHIKAPTHENIHPVYAVGNNRATRLWVWKLPPGFIFDNVADIPDSNPFIKFSSEID